MTPFVFNTSKSIQFGAGQLGKLGALARDQIGTRVMLITDPGESGGAKLVHGSGGIVPLRAV